MNVSPQGVSLRVKAPAKINLSLDIIGVDKCGYHLMDMLMQSIDLYDTVTVQKRAHGIVLTCNCAEIPCNENNICARCARAFFARTGIVQGVSIDIEKVIPQQAGMAGGSADGAATLVGLNALYQTGLSLETLCVLGATVGADIPFCLIGGTARVTGFGEKIEPVAPLPDCSIVIAKPRSGISTQRAFAAFDKAQILPKLDMEDLLRRMKAKDITAFCAGLYNAMEQVCPLPDVRAIKNLMRSCGAKGALMTGSGSAVFGIFTDRSRAYACEQKLRIRYADSFLCRPVANGAFVVEEKISF